MLHFPKSHPEPPCLKDERLKTHGTYDCGDGDVLKRLQQDFHNKCYICEARLPSLVIEHFVP